MFSCDCRDLDDLTNMKAMASISTPTFGPEGGPSPDPPKTEPEEPRMIGDYDGNSKGLWKLFRDEAKSHDGVQTNTLKDDMGNSLVFVRSYPILTYDLNSVVLTRGLTGRFIFRRPHCVRS